MVVIILSPTKQTNQNRGGGRDGESVHPRRNDHCYLLGGPSSALCDLPHECGCECDCRVYGLSCSRWFRNYRCFSKVCSCSPRMSEPGSNLYIGGSYPLHIRLGSFHRIPWSPNELVPMRYRPGREAIVGGRKDSERRDRRCVGTQSRSWRRQ